MSKKRNFELFCAIALLLCGGYPSGVSAQKKGRKVKKEIKKSTSNVAKPASTLVSEYRFDEAIQAYTKELNAAKRNRELTEPIEEGMQKARLGADMLRGTERVIIVDSMVVSRDRFIEAYRLSKGSGHLGKLAEFIPAFSSYRAGETAFINDFKDYVVFAMPDKNGLKKLVSSTRLGNKWSNPQPLNGMGQSDDVQDYPYLMADGLTLYFAAQGSESLGGYDIFVTRRGSSTSDFVKAENVGMPFNSPANDYLMVIDENANIGWFVSDRNQSADKVCIYRFIPNDTREIYELKGDNEDEIRNLAQLTSISDTHFDKKAVAEAQKRIAELMSSDGNTRKRHAFRFVLDDQHVITHLSQFRNAEARTLAQKCFETGQQISEAIDHLDALREQYAKRKTVTFSKQILESEKALEEACGKLSSMEKRVRQLELGK